MWAQQATRREHHSQVQEFIGVALVADIPLSTDVPGPPGVVAPGRVLLLCPPHGWLLWATLAPPRPRPRPHPRRERCPAPAPRRCVHALGYPRQFPMPAGQATSRLRQRRRGDLRGVFPADRRPVPARAARLHSLPVLR